MLTWMSHVHLGEGSLDGRGLYASRSFEEGEVVVSYELRRLTRGEYSALPEDERLFVHSYWGERWLYPTPARYVNHADTPNTWQDFDRQCDIALRRIEAGELITTDARKETDRELETFLRAYETAVNGNQLQRLEALVDDGAFGWVETRGEVDKVGIVEAPLDAAIDRDTDPCLTVRNPKWIIGTGRWEAVCSYDCDTPFHSGGHVTDVLKVVDGNWQIIYRHESRA
jgi:hypothetical protein